MYGGHRYKVTTKQTKACLAKVRKTTAENNWRETKNAGEKHKEIIASTKEYLKDSIVLNAAGPLQPVPTPVRHCRLAMSQQRSEGRRIRF